MSADYVIVGGGTAGLVVANRLSEDENTSVIVLEAGDDRTEDNQVQNPICWPSLIGSVLDWEFKTVPQTGLNNREQEHPAGKVLGGSSTINGLVYIPPSPAGIDAWARLGNDKWNWNALLPYLQRSYRLRAPDEIKKEFNLDAHNTGRGPISVSYPSLADERNHPLINAWNDTFKEQGYEFTGNFLPEKTVGTRPYTATTHDRWGLGDCRSASDTEYGRNAFIRPNLDVRTGVTVRRVLFSSASGEAIATGVEVYTRQGLVTIKAKEEVILAAGAFNTPKILELSGIGDGRLLSKLGIPTIIDNPGVGENLQNHLMSFLPVPVKRFTELDNAPPGIKALGFVNLDQREQADLLSRFSPQSKHDEVIRSIIQNPDEASATALLSLCETSEHAAIVVLFPSFPISRGSTHVSSQDAYVKPTIDPRFLSKRIDLEIMARLVQNLHQVPASPAFEEFFEYTNPGLDLDAIKESIHERAISTHHVCGTAAMLPKEDGGVVDQNLRVYGTGNLRIADASIFPLIPSANPMSTVYAVAERAADLIRYRHF
ncbi:hypothetical protein ASPWEDRAFT_140426 [Aspergillus wentii DTO 134E9]|uniref:Glucose-methanol-choline oxidoreductase N-terminal domain-containing protein n=1 Tax=Aspergillus wentii DTO 134E9 TaxID=1073089 RepID=A0A1L9RCF0_ASPWE|nr:uncharacterized protein ASPWEDRAFT_140426 [Aspergillus wentii DTO 134E9]OJJ32543.1 hypothetical protein ASPWEDRAFT_140426 [Aspergillus wentii DTO 134E9]